jgi:hypothetical protein
MPDMLSVVCTTLDMLLHLQHEVLLNSPLGPSLMPILQQVGWTIHGVRIKSCVWGGGWGA